MAKKRQALALLEPILIDTFGLERLVPPQPILSEWLDASSIDSGVDFDAIELFLLKEIQTKLSIGADFWNKEELKMKNIGLLLLLAKLEQPIDIYYSREISASINGIFMRCTPDMLLAKGIQGMIETAYFFAEFEDKRCNNDPVGKMLGAMLIAQANNNNGKPLYGCYVQGRFWFFSVLIGKQYVISNSFNASEITHLHQIIFILRKLKQIILERLMD